METSTIATVSIWDAPSPILFNTRKHHAGFLRLRIAETIAAGPAALQTLADELIVHSAGLAGQSLSVSSARRYVSCSRS